MTPHQAQQLAEKEYPDRFSHDLAHERLRAAFLNGLSKAHMWQKLSEDWKPEARGYYWVSDGDKKKAEAHWDGTAFIYARHELSIDIEFPVTHVIPIFKPELPNDQNTIV